jgi:hypothetical protein
MSVLDYLSTNFSSVDPTFLCDAIGKQFDAGMMDRAQTKDLLSSIKESVIHCDGYGVYRAEIEIIVSKVEDYYTEATFTKNGEDPLMFRKDNLVELVNIGSILDYTSVTLFRFEL